MSQEKLWLLLSKKLSGEATAEEVREFENLIYQHPEWQYAIQNIEEIWRQSPHTGSEKEEEAYFLHLCRMNELNIPFGYEPATLSLPDEKRSNRKWYWMAAAVLVALCIGAVFFFNGRKNSAATAPLVNEISTKQGSKSKVQLPDGSIVWLNAGSKISYDKNFGQSTRELTLIGEAFFDVVKMNNKPFVINTATIQVKVLGTVFNVKAYPEDKQTETSLIRGKVEVTIRNRPESKIILSPNEKLIIENHPLPEHGKSAIEKEIPQPNISLVKLKQSPVDSTVAEIQWVENKLVFNDESFEEVAVRMQRWYDVQVEITDPLLKQKRMTGNFEKETIDQALEALRMMTPFRYEQRGSKIIIHR